MEKHNVAAPRDDRQKDLLRPALDEIIDLGHPLARLSGRDRLGLPRPALRAPRSVRQVQVSPACRRGWSPELFILKHMHNLSDEALCARWLRRSLYYQFFCGELSFCHKLPFDRSSLTRAGGSGWARSNWWR